MLGPQIINVPVNVQYTYYFFLTSSVGGAGLTGKAFNNFPPQISKNGGSFATCSNAPSEIGKGWYSLVLTSTEMNAQDILLLIETNTTSVYDAVWICTTSVGPSAVNANVTQWAGTNVVTPDVAGAPKVTIDSGTGTGQLSLSSGLVTVGTNNDKTGYSISTQVTAQKNVGLNNFEFLMVSSSDHITPATGLTVSGQVSIDGGSFASLTNSVSEISNGVYKVDLAAADLNGTIIMLLFTATGGDPRYIELITQG